MRRKFVSGLHFDSVETTIRLEVEVTEPHYQVLKDPRVLSVLALISYMLTAFGVLTVLSGDKVGIFGYVCIGYAGLVALVTLRDVLVLYVHINEKAVTKRVLMFNLPKGMDLAALPSLMVWMVLAIPALIYRVIKHIG